VTPVRHRERRPLDRAAAGFRIGAVALAAFIVVGALLSVAVAGGSPVAGSSAPTGSTLGPLVPVAVLAFLGQLVCLAGFLAVRVIQEEVV
jgi:hypothetical protein